MTIPAELEGALLKVKRAKRHAADLNVLIKKPGEHPPYKFASKEDSESGYILIYIAEIDAVFFNEASGIIGDIVHNLRSALDHLAYALVFKGTEGEGIVSNKSGDPFGHVYFPISYSVQAYNETKVAKLKGATPAMVSAIDDVMPYKGGNDELWMLNRLDIIDKHRLLVTVGGKEGSVAFPPPLISGDSDFVKDANNEFRDIFPKLFINSAEKRFPLNKGDVLTKFPVGTDFQPNSEVKFKIQVAFDEPGIFEGEPVESALHELTNVVENLIKDFIPFFT